VEHTQIHPALKRGTKNIHYTQPPKKPRPLLHARALKKNLKRFQKKLCACLYRQWPAAGGRPLVTTRYRPRSPDQGRPLLGERSAACDQRLSTAPIRVPFFAFFLPPSSYLLPPNFAHVVNSSSLALTHARPA
jgi:hypothetical protein